MATDPVHVTVLLSAYNGAAYIAQQIDSILQQHQVQVQLLIRDDGSTDQTPALLTALAAQHNNIDLILGENLGVAGSFFALLEAAARLADGGVATYYALADQDDVWHTDKLVRACAALEHIQTDQPLLYCSAVNYVDQHLQYLRGSRQFSQARIGFKNALVQNIATGCTMVFNPWALRTIVASLPRHCVMHDWWIYLLISALGRVIYDPQPSMQYRQHPHNVLGIAPSWRARMVRRWHRIMNPQSLRISSQLLELERLVGKQLDAADQQILLGLINARYHVLPRFGLLFSRTIQRQHFFDSVLIRVLILVGKF